MPLQNYNTLLKKALTGIFILTGILLLSCKKNTITTNSSAKLTFSQNALFFDTVFTTVGSTVQAFLVHNNNNQAIQISSVKLVGSYTSPYKVNIDGTPGTSFSNITIPANDSIYVFVTVTINPTNVNNPFFVNDSLQFITNGNTQYVSLNAYGQNAYFYKPNIYPLTGPAYSIVKCGDMWKPDKPHVVSGYLVVNTGCTLTIEPGTQVYMHNNAVLWVYQGGTLNVLGKSDSTVNFQGDRLEPAYQNVPGQWGEIWLSPGCKSCSFSWAVIKNGTIGIEADTVASWASPTLRIDHSIIKGMSQLGLLGQGSYIVGSDDLVANCQYYCVDLSIGGKYSFAQCTFANYWSYGQRQTPLLIINNWYQDVYGNYQNRAITQAYFGNCIIYGSLTEEIALDSGKNGSGAAFNYYFEQCDLATQQSTSVGYHFSNNMIINQDPGFESASTDNYVPTNSILQGVNGAGNDTVGHDPNYVYDLNGNFRSSLPYDLGAYIVK